MGLSFYVSSPSCVDITKKMHPTTQLFVWGHLFGQTRTSILRTLVTQSWKGKFVLSNTISRAPSSIWSLWQFFKRDPLSPHRLFFLINSKWSFICTFQQTGQHIPQSLMDQLWTTSCRVMWLLDARELYTPVTLLLTITLQVQKRGSHKVVNKWSSVVCLFVCCCFTP